MTVTTSTDAGGIVALDAHYTTKDWSESFAIIATAS
jgi:hypothetical protein